MNKPIETKSPRQFALLPYFFRIETHLAWVSTPVSREHLAVFH